MNGDMDWEHIGSVSRTDSKIPICNFGRGVTPLSDPSEVITAGSSGDKSNGVSSSTLESVMVWAREKGSGRIYVVEVPAWEAHDPAGKPNSIRSVRAN